MTKRLPLRGINKYLCSRVMHQSLDTLEGAIVLATRIENAHAEFFPGSQAAVAVNATASIACEIALVIGAIQQSLTLLGYYITLGFGLTQSLRHSSHLALACLIGQL